jgi:hypothetical protein
VSKTFSALCACLTLAGLVGFASPAAADPAGSNHCFLSRNWEGWKSPDPNTIYVRVSVDTYYRFDLSAGSDQLKGPGVHLVTDIRGTSWICDPLDMRLYVVDNHGAFREPLFVKAITRLTPDEVAAIPSNFRP